MPCGTVAMWKWEGYGFITPDGGDSPDIYVNKGGLMNSNYLTVGDYVSYTVF